MWFELLFICLVVLIVSSVYWLLHRFRAKSLNPSGLPILCLDFDGVLHSYSSGWKGAAFVPDPPVPGALDFLVLAVESKEFEVCIFSSRTHQRGGVRAMQTWIDNWFQGLAKYGDSKVCEAYVRAYAFTNPWDEEVRFAAKRLVNSIRFPKEKPPALVTLDDRAIQFTGVFPKLGELKKFKPWNRKD